MADEGAVDGRETDLPLNLPNEEDVGDVGDTGIMTCPLGDADVTLVSPKSSPDAESVLSGSPALERGDVTPPAAFVAGLGNGGMTSLSFAFKLFRFGRKPLLNDLECVSVGGGPGGVSSLALLPPSAPLLAALRLSLSLSRPMAFAEGECFNVRERNPPLDVVVARLDVSAACTNSPATLESLDIVAVSLEPLIIEALDRVVDEMDNDLSFDEDAAVDTSGVGVSILGPGWVDGIISLVGIGRSGII